MEMGCTGESKHGFSYQHRTNTKAKYIHIDPRYSDTNCNSNDEWLPIRPGTDAALAAAIAHVLISENLVDKTFLDTYCIGYDEDTMPESAKGQNKSYKDYIMGTGYDKVEKTPNGPRLSRLSPPSASKSLHTKWRRRKPRSSRNTWACSATATARWPTFPSACSTCFWALSGKKGCTTGCTTGAYSFSIRGLPLPTRANRRFPCSLGPTPSTMARR